MTDPEREPDCEKGCDRGAGSMAAFAALLERLVLTPSRTGKLRLLGDYFRTTPDPDRGYALAAMTRDLKTPHVTPATFRTLITARMDPVLFDLSYDYVGDLAETIALAWPERGRANARPALGEIVETLQAATRPEAAAAAEAWLDALDASGRWALIKLATGGLRVGVSGRLARQALALFGGREAAEIEELWHGLSVPYTALFAWLEGRGPRPEPAHAAPFRPVMLAHAIAAAADLEPLRPQDYLAEWKWDGARVQAVCGGGARRLYTRTGDEISAAFPDVLPALGSFGEIALDGELLVFDPARSDPDKGSYVAAAFGALQQRLNRKTVSKTQLQTHPAFLRVYDLLQLDGEDLRALPFAERRRRLEVLATAEKKSRIDLSPLVPFETWEALAALRAAPPTPEIEGVMIKRRLSAYRPGRPRGEWWKWKREPFVIDAVLLYAQRGHGRRSSLYSDFTFGVWRQEASGRELVPVGKSYSGFTDEELGRLDRFVRDHTTDRFGPVRQVRADEETGLVLEIAFEGLNRSGRHKSGLAMRFPRIARIRWDKPSREADDIAALEAMLDAGAG